MISAYDEFARLGPEQSFEPVYEYAAKQLDGERYFYSLSKVNEEGWDARGVVFHVPRPFSYTVDLGAEQYIPSSYDTTQICQFHAVQAKQYGGVRHLFWKDKNPIKEGWVFDKIAFHAYCDSSLKFRDKSIVPVFKFHRSQKDGYRFYYSLDAEPKEGWISDGEAFYTRKV